MHLSKLLLPFLSILTLAAAHARIKTPIPLNAPPEDPTGNAYNAPLSATGSDFPCKNLHTAANIAKTPLQSWTAGSPAFFEILGHVTAGEGALAAHSGGSCQASISFDNGVTWRVLHTYHGGCPRDVALNSNLAGPNQIFPFIVPAQTKSGPALFAWTWIAVSGNRDEFYMDCAAVQIAGTGTNTLTDYPNMYVGEMNIPGQINPGECRSTAGTALLYPNPGPADRVTQTTVQGIPFKAPTGGNCFAPGSKAPAPVVSAPVVSVPVVSVPTTMATVVVPPSSVAAPPTSVVAPPYSAVAPPSSVAPPPMATPTPAYTPPPASTPSYAAAPAPSSESESESYSHVHHHHHYTPSSTTSCEPTPSGNTYYARWNRRS